MCTRASVRLIICVVQWAPQHDVSHVFVEHGDQGNRTAKQYLLGACLQSGSFSLAIYRNQCVRSGSGLHVGHIEPDELFMLGINMNFIQYCTELYVHMCEESFSQISIIIYVNICIKKVEIHKLDLASV